MRWTAWGHDEGTRPSMRMRQAVLLAFVWLNASEIARYVFFVMPMTRAAMPQITNAAPMNGTVFAIWAAWDTLLFVCAAFVIWLVYERFGANRRGMVLAATTVWATVFVIFWLATWNMNMTVARIPMIALPLAWLEMLGVAAIIGWGLRRPLVGAPYV